jgi:hypothetical protein
MTVMMRCEPVRGGSIVAVAPGFPDGDFQNHRLAIGDKIALVAW